MELFCCREYFDVVIGRSSDVKTSEVLNTNSEVFAKLFKFLTKMVKFCRARLVMSRTVYYSETLLLYLVYLNLI